MGTVGISKIEDNTRVQHKTRPCGQAALVLVLVVFATTMEQFKTPIIAVLNFFEYTLHYMYIVMYLCSIVTAYLLYFSFSYFILVGLVPVLYIAAYCLFVAIPVKEVSRPWLTFAVIALILHGASIRFVDDLPVFSTGQLAVASVAIAVELFIIIYGCERYGFYPSERTYHQVIMVCIFVTVVMLQAQAGFNVWLHPSRNVLLVITAALCGYHYIYTVPEALLMLLSTMLANEWRLYFNTSQNNVWYELDYYSSRVLVAQFQGMSPTEYAKTNNLSRLRYADDIETRWRAWNTSRDLVYINNKENIDRARLVALGTKLDDSMFYPIKDVDPRDEEGCRLSEVLCTCHKCDAPRGSRSDDVCLYSISNASFEPGLIKYRGCGKDSIPCFLRSHCFGLGLNIPPCCLINMKTMTRDVSAVFKKFNIEHWIDGGTLLGYTRNGMFF